MSQLEHEYGKHGVYLQMPHDLFVALNVYSKKLGVPRSRVIFDILRGFLGPVAEQQRVSDDE